MARFLLAVTVLSYVITPIAHSADGPENRTLAARSCKLTLRLRQDHLAC